MQFNKSQILAMSEGGFFGDGNAQLPSDAMLMIDQISNISNTGGLYGKGKLEASLQILPDHWFFGCHFKGDPVMPGCLGLDALWQLLGVFLGWSGLPGKGRALGVDNVKFSGQIYPDAGFIQYQLDIRRVFSKPMAMGIADGLVIHNDKIIYQATNLKVGLINT
ncbi:MAG: bifunctional 3-hydroxydecanoyl-ACP dehydratase/trans-2-decenoyl-ACP isomerase [Gammaproteobacteria bacterium]|nr:bifunctional 3-hydroxydecanoyl-ACP dehydratase/trans-2-decenoyl-ACP isomerase [Gammaproteobacteria bacterium]